jgi:NAD(P)-dependent dehydrogenase (short-subunit alcohol dehydrogenase family)
MKGKTKKFPKQNQKVPGSQSKMYPKPEVIRSGYKGSGKLKDKIAIITGGISCIGRSVAVHFAREGANIIIVFHSDDKNTKTTKELVDKEARKCVLIKGNIRNKEFCKSVINKTIRVYGDLNILVNNAVEQINSTKRKLTNNSRGVTWN